MSAENRRKKETFNVAFKNDYIELYIQKRRSCQTSIMDLLQPFADVLRKFCNIHWKIPVLESLFNKAGLKDSNFIQKRLQHRDFPGNIAKLLRTSFSHSSSGRLLLVILFSHIFLWYTIEVFVELYVTSKWIEVNRLLWYFSFKRSIERRW